MKAQKFPSKLTVQGVRYTLHRPKQVISIDPPITDGPFYAREGVNPNDWAYRPDIEFLAGLRDTPSYMILTQQRHPVQTPRPAS